MKNKTEKILIAGPCSAESAEQMLQSAAMLSLISSHGILRAGCWKPRTSPGGFSGYGEEALRWLKDAADAYALPWITEAGTAAHAEKILRAGGTQLWIGARTTGDPFAVSEIAIAMEGTGAGVWIKNPPQPDVKLWAGAAERFLRRAVPVHGFIHRGYKTWPQTEWRNAPHWNVQEELRTIFPGARIISDPSHMTGQSGRVAAAGLTALQLGADGLMVEMHPHPENAMTDRGQQLSPGELLELKCAMEKTGKAGEIGKLRTQIDELDEMLWAILGERMRMAEKIGAQKHSVGMEVLQEKRRAEVKSSFRKNGHRCGLTPAESGALFEWLHAVSVRKQNDVTRIPEKSHA
ncbi:MAG TPA: bifunctional 3-deoxy-7-phosphoheptulonate synthase/chorismate mutase type II [Bacteroidia bacterium]|nr:bifunctional 3-deoxy-7-phosphoheptulonate synthase/chorismate mutase type II [Bacteroidia bacterium]